MSGGEEKAIDLSLQYAFLDLIYEKSLLIPDVLIQDEILDSSIDTDSLEQFFNIIKNKQEQHDLSLYIISHRKEVELVNADHIIKVEKVNGFSKLVEN
jgi:Fe-S cluster assembly ATPase SufC